ncbi:MAG: lasso peptide biosynthesis B2 protein [Bacteroidales bacterium]
MAVIEGERLKGRMVHLAQGFRKFGELPWKEQLLFSEAYFLHLATGLILKVIPFRWIPRVFSSPLSSVGSRQSEEIEPIKTAIGRASRVSPWKNKCMVSSLVARRMLNKRKIPSKLSLGVAKDTGGRTVAHAWIISGDIEVTGKHGDYQELFVF